MVGAIDWAIRISQVHHSERTTYVAIHPRRYGDAVRAGNMIFPRSNENIKAW
jgi:hypothetical protein